MIGQAARNYEKDGFRKIKLLHNHELFERKMENCYLMEKRLHI